jgi:hypothetical protein
MVLENEKLIIRKAILGNRLDVIFCVSDSGKLWYQDFPASEFNKYFDPA